jgi:hypothetical protein
VSALSDLSHGYPIERLVPGEPDGVRGFSRALSSMAALLADTARALGRIAEALEDWDQMAHLDALVAQASQSADPDILEVVEDVQRYDLHGRPIRPN